MYPFSYTGLRLVHDEKVCDAMERACIDRELVRNSQRTAWLFLLSNLPTLIRNRLNVFARVEHPRRCLPLQRDSCAPEER